MKNLLTILSMVFFTHCIGQLHPVPTKASYKAPLFLEDTVMNGIYDAGGKVMHIEGNISGNVTITNAIIEANLYIRIFDTTVILQNCRTKEFSTAWYGAKNTNEDNSVQLQKSISTCIANGIKNLYCAESYSYSQTLSAFNIYGGNYVGFGLNFYGDGDRWDTKQTLIYTGKGNAFQVQYAKGGSISKLGIKGNSPGSGIVVDYDGSKNTGGTTGFFIEDMFVDGFDVLYDISQNGKTFNADILRLTNIHCGNCRVAFRSGQAQEKGNVIDGIYSWGTCQILIQIGKSGKSQAGKYDVYNCNIAGNCHQLFDINLAGWNGFSLRGGSVEGISTLGTITAWNSVYMPPVNISDLTVRFLPGTQTLFTSNSSKVQISNCALWFYNGVCCQQMNFSGPFIWDNNDCGSCVINDPQILYKTPAAKSTITYQ